MWRYLIISSTSFFFFTNLMTRSPLGSQQEVKVTVTRSTVMSCVLSPSVSWIFVFDLSAASAEKAEKCLEVAKSQES